MILAQNHLPLLSGNKPYCWVFAFLFLFTFSSCDLFKKLPDGPDQAKDDKEELDPIQGRRVYDPETGTYVIVEDLPTEKMDTIRWRNLPEAEYPPITSTGSTPPPVLPGTTRPGVNTNSPIGPGVEGGQRLTSYKVSVLLPFLTDQYSVQTGQISSRSDWALHFYSGMKMGIDELRQQGINLDLNVFDSRANGNAVNNLVKSNPDIQSAHLIIGPYRKDNVSIVAEEVKRLGSVLVSPYSASSNVSRQNANYVQVNPTLESHCQSIMKHVYDWHNPRSVILVARKNQAEVERFKYFQDEYRKLNQLRDTTSIRELIIDPQNENMVELDLSPMLSNFDTTVFILPIWSDESFVSTFLQRLAQSKDPYDPVVVYGMPQWMNYDRVDVELYERLNVHVSSSVYVDYRDPDIKSFRQRFFDRYGTVPEDEAFVGFDVIRYFGMMLNKYGTRFQLALDSEPMDLLHTRFAFEKVSFENPDNPFGGRPMIERIENKYLNILEFKNYRFQRAK